MLEVRDLEGKAIGDVVQFVTFDLSDSGACQTMALNVQKIKEVVDYLPLSELPGSKIPVMGVFNLRGVPVPVLDLTKIFGATRWELKVPSRILICELQKIWVGIPVSKTGRIYTCESSHFLPPPKVVDFGENRFYSGLIRKENGFIPVLDIDNILLSIGFGREESSDKDHRLNPYRSYEGKRALVVEDSKVIQRRLEKLLKNLGMEVVLASDGQEGFQKVCKDGAKFDVIFSDIEMPVCDGIAMARMIKRKVGFENIPILFNSALSNPALIRDIQNEALGKYLVKFDEDLILSELAATLK